MATSTRIEIGEEIEGEEIESDDYFFQKVGESIPITKDDISQFDLQKPPSRPLAVSQLTHQLIFAAHSSGFSVARTKDVIAAAEETKESGKGCSIQELSVVDIPFESVHILALSNDESTLAVSLSQSPDLHFFSVDTLLNKEIKPSFSCSLSKSTYVKDIRWRKNAENSFLVLSNVGKLYRGSVDDGTLQDVMDNVDAVEWSVKGKFVAVAEKNILNILTSKFKKRFCISLSFKSWVGDAELNCSIKVDSIQWVRRDCIIIGCFQLAEDEREENYLVQVIQSKDGTITDASSKPVVLSFSDVFAGFIDDIFPPGTGPYLFLSYLEQCELAISANRKNTDRHIVFLGWSLRGEKDHAAAVDIKHDKWRPRIELQDNGDENVIMGLCVDKVSHYGKVKVQLGLEDQTELSPCCLLMCLTLEGELIMFHVASVSGTSVSSDVDTVLSDEEDDVSVYSDQRKVSSESVQQKIEQIDSSLKLQDVQLKEVDAVDTGQITSKPNLKDFEKYEMSTSIFSSQELANKDGQRTLNSQEKNTNVVQPLVKASLPEVNSFTGRDSNETGTQNPVEFGPASAGFSGKFPSDTRSFLSHKDLSKSLQFGKKAEENCASAGAQSSSSQSWSSGKFILSENSGVKSPFLPSSHGLGKTSEYSSVSLGTANVSGSFARKPLSLKDVTSSSTSILVSGKPVHGDCNKNLTGVGKIESLPSVRSTQFASQLNFSSGNSHSQKLCPSKVDWRSPLHSGLPNSEQTLSKQSGNIKEMANELDMLLQSIEETGGFRDACTVSQKCKVEKLEEGIGTLSEKCRIWRTIMDERLEEIQNLVDRTIQVLTRKLYMEGVVKQVSDDKYWDLRNRQKLSPELELKRGHILNLNQDLTHQLIELERHFNNIELDNFGTNYGVHGCQRGSQSRLGTSRHMQSVHSLHATMSLQLAAAEQLSERLSKQMAALSLETHVKQQNMKKELFETIGILYDASFNSPDMLKFRDQSLAKKLVHSSGSAATRDLPGRHQSSAIKSYDPETVRRRRDSLDRSWGSFEPPKTTVKRMLLQEQQKSPVNSSMKDKQHIRLGGAATVHLKDQTTPLTSSNPSGIKASAGKQDTSLKQTYENQSILFKWASDPAGPSQITGFKFPFLQSASFQSSLSAAQLSATGWKNHSGGTSDVTACKLSSGDSSGAKSTFIDETKPVSHSESNLLEKPTISTMSTTWTPSLLKNPGGKPISNNKGTAPLSSTVGTEEHRTTAKTFVESGEDLDAQLSMPAATSTLPSFPGILQSSSAATIGQPVRKTSTSSAFSFSISAASSPVISSLSTPAFALTASSSTTSFTTALNGSLSTRSTVDTEHKISSTSMFITSSVPIGSSSSLSGSIPITSSASLTSPCPVESLSQLSASLSTTFSSSTLPAPEPPLSLSTSPPSMNSISELCKTDLQLPKEEAKSTANVRAITHAPPVQLVYPASKLEPQGSSASEVGMSSVVPSESLPNITSVASSASNVAANAQLDNSSTMNTHFPIPLGNSTGPTCGKNETLDIAVTPEDEMEEEASDTSNATELTVGNLGSFGISSIPNSTAPKPNPFGGPFKNAAVSSPFTMTVPSGELFRPASFSFQSPQPSQPSQPAVCSGFAGGFGTGTTAQAPTQTGFGHPAQIGTAAQAPTQIGLGQQAQIGQGQQALGSVLGSFGQSRQLGTGPPGAGFASARGFGGNFTPSSTGGFSSAATGGGFAGVANTGGGFGGLASAGGGFAAAASPGGGGFGGFSSPQGSGFGGGAGGTGKPPELFTQMRK